MTTTIPIVASVAIQNEHILTFQGQTAVIGIEIRSNGVWTKKSLITTTEAPLITLYRPDNTIRIEDDVMTAVATGRYAYAYPTTIDDPVGLWTARFTAISSNAVAKADRVGVFLLVRSTIATFTVFLIKDQDSVIWYWYVDFANQSNSVQAPPIGIARAPDFINKDLVPGWIRYLNQQGAVRYLYPDVAGQFTVAFTPPPIGPEWLNSPIFTAQSGAKFTFSSDIAEQMILVPVI